MGASWLSAVHPAVFGGIGYLDITKACVRNGCGTQKLRFSQKSSNTGEGKGEVHCKGCIHMELPFWGGPCEVQSCCEEKKLNHCGERADFPCDMVADTGREQGFDPEPRLTNCRKWAGLQ